MNELHGPGPDGNSADVFTDWNVPVNADDDGQD